MDVVIFSNQYLALPILDSPILKLVDGEGTMERFVIW